MHGRFCWRWSFTEIEDHLAKHGEKYWFLLLKQDFNSHIILILITCCLTIATNQAVTFLPNSDTEELECAAVLKMLWRAHDWGWKIINSLDVFFCFQWITSIRYEIKKNCQPSYLIDDSPIFFISQCTGTFCIYKSLSSYQY